jgi:hypothetical protein
MVVAIGGSIRRSATSVESETAVTPADAITIEARFTIEGDLTVVLATEGIMAGVFQATTIIVSVMREVVGIHPMEIDTVN